MNGYTIHINIRLMDGERELQEIACGLSGNVQGNRVHDLTWDEEWLNKYVDPDSYYEQFMQEIEAMRIDAAYDKYKDRGLRI